MAENQLKGKLFGVHRHQTIKASINASHMNQNDAASVWQNKTRQFSLWHHKSRIRLTMIYQC